MIKESTTERGHVSSPRGSIRILTSKALHILKSKGLEHTIRRAAMEIGAPRRPRRPSPHYYFISHPFDFTGAPLVLLDLISDFASQVDPSRLHLLHPSGTDDLLGLLRAKKVNVERMIDDAGMRTIESQMRLRRDDFVLMNTVSVPFAYRHFIFNRLERGMLDRAVWFIHEDGPHRWFSEDPLRDRTKSLLDAGKLTIVVPSSQVARAYRDYFDTVNVHPIALRVTLPEGMMPPRRADDYDTLRFVMSGNPRGGLKGQLLAIAALHKSSCSATEETLEGYRDFELHLVGGMEDDYVSRQVGIIGEGLLPGRIWLYPHLSRDAALEIARSCNVTICTSFTEAFPLFVAEGMLMGHVLVRNLAAGHEEQLQDGVNGFLVDTSSLDALVNAFGNIRDRRISNEQLQRMSLASQIIAREFTSNNYYLQLNHLLPWLRAIEAG